MGIIKMEQRDLRNQNKQLLINIIYNNFIHLNPEPKLNHTKEAIGDTLNNDDVVLLLFMDNGKIGGYLLAQSMILEDGRKVMFISYIYVANQLRKHGVGTKLLHAIEKEADIKYCDGLMLIYDTTQKNLRRFYDRNGYMLDFQLRRYEKNDVFYKVL